VDGLNERQKLFCEEYLVDLNATQAAIRAGYSAKTANKIGPKLLVNVGIQTYISELRAKRSEKTEVTAIRVIEELALIAFSNVDDYRLDANGHLVMKDGTRPERMRAIASKRHKVKRMGDDDPGELVECDIKLWDKNKALDTLCKYLGLLKAELPPIESLLSRLPNDVAQKLRPLLTANLSG
jgi:phage terminase small subunit